MEVPRYVLELTKDELAELCSGYLLAGSLTASAVELKLAVYLWNSGNKETQNTVGERLTALMEESVK